MAKVAILADANTALGFRLVGADIYVIEQTQELDQLWSEIKRQNYAVIFITEDLYQEKHEDIERFNQVSLTAVSLIPSASGSKNLAKSRLRTLIKRAVGKEM